MHRVAHGGHAHGLRDVGVRHRALQLPNGDVVLASVVVVHWVNEGSACDKEARAEQWLRAKAAPAQAQCVTCQWPMLLRSRFGPSRPGSSGPTRFRTCRPWPGPGHSIGRSGQRSRPRHRSPGRQCIDGKSGKQIRTCLRQNIGPPHLYPPRTLCRCLMSPRTPNFETPPGSEFYWGRLSAHHNLNFGWRSNMILQMIRETLFLIFEKLVTFEPCLCCQHSAMPVGCYITTQESKYSSTSSCLELDWNRVKLQVATLQTPRVHRKLTVHKLFVVSRQERISNTVSSYFSRLLVLLRATGSINTITQYGVLAPKICMFWMSRNMCPDVLSGVRNSKRLIHKV